LLVALAVAAAVGTGTAQAQISDNVIKIGVLSDMSSLYTDLAGAAPSSPRRWQSRIRASRSAATRSKSFRRIIRTSRM
jgi:hypothetical protein